MTNNKLHKLLIADNKIINAAIQETYTSLLKYYNENCDSIPKYVADELSEIIHLIEISENYNLAFKKMHYLELELSDRTCKHSYV